MYHIALYLSVFISVAYCDCPVGWAVNGNSCYFLSTEFGGIEKHLSFHEALSYCEVQNGHLAVIEDQTENDFIQKRLTDKGIQGQHWIGLHDLSSKDVFQWVDGSPLVYTNWQEGDPDHYDHGPKPGVLAEACVEFIADGDNKGQWRDNSCTPRQHYICERDINVGPSTVCADDWIKYQDKCYHFGKEQITWTDAQQSCKDMSSNLVAITSSEEQTFVASEINNNNAATWIGLTTIDSEDGKTLYWSNMNDEYDKSSSYSNWATAQPIISRQNSDCVEINPGASSNGEWSVARCGETYDYMCERQFEGSCAEGWRMFNGSCYLIVTGGDFETNWVEAHDFCKATGGDMLVIESDWEMSYIRSRLSEIEDTGSSGLWIGVSDTDQDGVFTWVDGTMNVNILYDNWGPNQPFDNQGSWDCGSVYSSSSNGNWETEDCFKKQSFICEIPTGSDVSSPDITPTTHSGCPPGWLWWNNYCYIFEKAVPLSWSTAESKCVQYGGHLSSIGSNEENGFIAGHSSGNFWIGGTDAAQEGVFRWSDGNVFNYTDFQDGEPNSSGNCVQVWADANYRWDDLPCDNERPYICKKQEKDCLYALGMESYVIKDGQITSTPPWNEYHRAALARLNNQPNGPDIGAWAPLEVAPGTQWIAVNLPVNKAGHTVVGVTTQGRPISSGYAQWVTSFNLQFSDDGNSWTDVTEDGQIKLFIGNDDSDTPVTNILPFATVTRNIKLIPQDYYGHPTLRMEVLGCDADGSEPNSQENECTAVETGDRLDCGYPGVSAEECKAKGCCWDTTYSGVPWCFYKQGKYDKRCNSPGWVYDPTGSFKCFYFNEQRHRSWTDARGFCKEIDITSDIITIQNAQEQAFVAGQLSTKPLTASFWIGADDQDPESGWMWKDGEEPFKYVNWADGQPDADKSTRGTNCAEMFTSDGTWNDINCNEERALACSKYSRIAPVEPVKGDPDSLKETTCEGEVNALVCYGNDVIVVEHAYYGRTDTKTCAYEDGYVPVGGCKSENDLELVQDMCNFKTQCEIYANNEMFGDPCPGVYKYLSVVYRCDPLDCYQYLGVSNGTIKDTQLSASSSLDASHQAIAGRLNGPMSWATTEGAGAWIQVTLLTPQTITGLVIQGAGDADRYVQTFTVGFATDTTYEKWIDYENDGVQIVFAGNKEASTPVRAIFANKLYTAGIRIYPVTWSGDMIGMRFEITGCGGTQEIGCLDKGDDYFSGDDIPVGTIVQGECKSGCQLEEKIPIVYGTDIYSGKSEVCAAAIHAGVILYTTGGPISMVKKEGQSAYEGSKQNNIFSGDATYYETAFSFTQSEKTCEKGWKPYGEYCYQLSDNVLSWAAAQEMCRSKGGDLAAIINSIHQDFIQSYIVETNSSSVWIGLNDLIQYNEYAWTDDKYVTYTNWAPGEPNNWEGKRESCVEIYTKTGKWNDANCDDVQPYMCEKIKDFYTAEETDGPSPDPGCDEGWVAFEDKCYFFDTEQYTGIVKSEDAQTYCQGLDAEMLSIKDKYVQSFIHSQIGQLDKFWWLGLQAGVEKDGSTTWRWQNGDLVEYDNWFYEEPNIKLGECGTFFGGPGFGFWYSYSCNLLAYPICQKARDPDAYTPRPDPTPPASGGCPGDWFYVDEGDDYYDEATKGYCYKVYSQDSNEEFTQQTWNNAKHQCMGLQGDLVSFHSKVEQNFIHSKLTKLSIEAQPIWTGLYSLNGRWTWSDGTALNFEDWRRGYPSIDPVNNCVVLKYEQRDGSSNWENVNCAETLDWICKREKGIVDIQPTSPPSGVPNPQCGSDSDGLWLEYEGLCYLFNDLAKVSYSTALKTCQATGGDLASIHSDLEQQFIANTVQDLTGTNHFWIGLREIGGSVGGEFSWTDGSIVDYVSWSAGEPNDDNGMEQCVDVRKAYGGDWNDANCALDISGFICKKIIGSVPDPPQPPTPVTGGCPSGWYSYAGYCFQLHGTTGDCDPEKFDNPDCAATWVDAQKICQKSAANLVTIHDKYENAFLTAQTLHSYHNMWIGLNDKSWSRYIWASGDEVTYTNWNSGEPNHSNGAENCVEILRNELNNGRWNDANCEDPKPYYCSKQQDPSIKVGNELNNNKKCKNGWIQFDTVNGEYLCYKYDETPRNFDDAVSYCKSQKATVASVQSMYEQNFLSSFLKENKAWIGLQLNVDESQWSWIDNWPVYITNWGEGQPGSDPSKGCAIYSDGEFGSEWLTASCTATYPTLCRSTTETVPTPQADIAGYCSDDNWPEYGGFCYYMYSLQGQTDNVDNVGVSWSDAEDTCKLMMGHLVSYTSRDELNTVWSNFKNYSETFWIGLRQNANGGWTWTDGRPVDFTWWNDGEPNNKGDENEGEDCAEQSGDLGKWNDLRCSSTRGFICRIPKVIGTDENGGAVRYTTPAPGPTKRTTNGAAVVIGILIAVVVLVAAVIGTVVYCKKQGNSTASKISDTAADFSSGFVNKLYSVSKSPSSTSQTDGVSFDKNMGSVSDDYDA